MTYYEYYIKNNRDIYIQTLSLVVEEAIQRKTWEGSYFDLFATSELELEALIAIHEFDRDIIMWTVKNFIVWNCDCSKQQLHKKKCTIKSKHYGYDDKWKERCLECWNQTMPEEEGEANDEL